jgi:hypothetical protein
VDTYLSPSLLSVEPDKRTGAIPVFRYQLRLDSGELRTRYHWILPAGTHFTVHEVEVLEDGGSPQRYQRKQLRGAQVLARGDVDGLGDVLPAARTLKVEALLPEGTELQAWYAKIAPLAHEQRRLEASYNLLRKSFIELMANHFGSLESALEVNDRARIQSHFKGLSVGKSLNPYGFFMKGIKTGYDALGFYRSTYGGLRLSDFGMTDLVEYVQKHRVAYPKSTRVEYDLVEGFQRVSTAPGKDPDPGEALTITGLSDTFTGIPAEYLKLIKDAMAHWRNTGAAMPMRSREGRYAPEQVLSGVFMDGLTDEPYVVHEYGFRGDGRSPLVIRNGGGFHPNAVRHFEKAEDRENFDKKRAELVERALAQYAGHGIPHFDPFLHQHNYDACNAFVSVSRATEVALGFVRMGGGNGHLYLVRSVGAIDQERTFQQVQYPGEMEISVPGGVDWADVIAVRPVVDGMPVDYCYVNTGNPWRAKERAVQDRAITRLMAPVLPDLGDL